MVTETPLLSFFAFLSHQLSKISFKKKKVKGSVSLQLSAAL